MNSLLQARRKFLKKLASASAAVVLLGGSTPLLAARRKALTGVRVSQAADDHTRVVFDLSGPVEHKLFTLENPSRVVVDLIGARKSTALSSDEKRTRLLKGIRSAERNGQDLRIVLDLDTRVRPRSFLLQPDSQSGYRLVIDMYKTRLSPTPIKTRREQMRKKAQQIVIAIDPGHGGKDPGALGRNGTREKDVVLALGRKLKRQIDATPGFRAVLTRDSDRFLPLRRRVATARKARADLFVSLHADSYKSPRVGGASVYALSLHGASSEAARLIAHRENASDLIGGISLEDKDDLIASVLLDLSQTATIQDSLELGQKVLGKIGKVSKLNKKTVQQAGFAVLKAPDMPSILVETAFISNPKEERRLKSSKYQHKLAKAIFSGIREHVNKQRIV